MYMKKVILLYLCCLFIITSSLHSSISIVDSITFRKKEYFENKLEATITFLKYYSFIPAFTLSKDLSDDESDYSKTIAFGASVDILSWLNLYGNYDYLFPIDDYKYSSIEVAPTVTIGKNNYITSIRIGYSFIKNEYTLTFNSEAEAAKYNIFSLSHYSLPGGTPNVPTPTKNLKEYTFELKQNVYDLSITETIHEKTTIEVGGALYEYNKELDVFKEKKARNLLGQGLALTQMTGILQFFPNYYINTGITRSFLNYKVDIFFYYILTKYELASYTRNGFFTGIIYYFNDNFSLGINTNLSENMSYKYESYLGVEIGYNF